MYAYCLHTPGACACSVVVNMPTGYSRLRDIMNVLCNLDGSLCLIGNSITSVTVTTCQVKTESTTDSNIDSKVSYVQNMGQPQLPVGFAVILTILLSSEYSLGICNNNVTTVCSTNESAILVLAVISTVYESDDMTQLLTWEKGEEILPGAHLAAKEINDISNLLSGYRLEVIPVRIPQCELSEGIVPFIEELTSNHNIVGTVGYLCYNNAQLLSRVAHYLAANAIQISATSVKDTRNNDSPSYLQHGILPLVETTVSTTIQLLQYLHWSKIGIISNQHSNFLESKRAFVRSAKEHDIQIVTHLDTFNSPKEYLQGLKMYGVKITVAFVSQSEAVDILCAAYLSGFKWPDYAWIFIDINKPKIFSDYCSQVEAINNAIFLYLAHATFNSQGVTVLPSGLNYSAYYDLYFEQLQKSSVELSVPLQSNPYAHVLYDSIWAVALTINRSLSVLNERNLSLTNLHQDTGFEVKNILEQQLSQLSFQGATGWLNFSHSAAAVQISVEVLSNAEWTTGADRILL